MGRDLATVRAVFKASKAPQLTESQRRLLADPFSLGSEVPAWEPPAVLPDSSKLRAVKQELERSLAEPHPGHVEWCTRKLFALPSRSNSEVEKAYQTENFLDACGHYPDDLWTWATTELLKVKTFRPSPAEMVAIAEPKFAERKRMLERVKIMLEGKPAIPARPFEREPRDVRLRTMRDGFRRLGKVFKAAGYERELAEIEGRTVEDWVRFARQETEGAELREAAVLPPLSAETRARTLFASAEFHRKEGRTVLADRYIADARALAPNMFVEVEVERRDVPEAAHV